MEEDTQEEYSDEVNSATVDELVSKVNQRETENTSLNQALNSSQQGNKDSNFLHVQISNTEMLEKLEHFYRGEIWGTDEDGNQDWIKPDDDDLVTFNNFGVSSLMEIITKYIDKNTTLSYYSEQRIFEIMSDIGNELVLFMLCNYKRMGMNTQFKKSKFRIIISTTLHLIESAYRRSIRGKTMEEINQSRIISQFGTPEQPQATPQMKRSGISKYFGNR